MDEQQFLKKLQQRAQEQGKITKGMLFPKLFTNIGLLFGDDPWKILIPFAFVITLIFHFIFGQNYDELILNIFGKL